jgi:hypothetical protein
MIVVTENTVKHDCKVDFLLNECVGLFVCINLM